MRTPQHVFTGAKNFAVENVALKSAGRNMTVYENCNIVTGSGGPVIQGPLMEFEEEKAMEGLCVSAHPRWTSDWVKETKLYKWVVETLMKTNVNFKSTHSDALSKRTMGTGLWFTQTDEYKKWTEENLQVIWGNGMRMFILPCLVPDG